MPNYKKMYLTLFHATEQAISLLVEAQRQCEELYINDSEPELLLLSPPNEATSTSCPVEEKSPPKQS